jgi:hypothetical protein
MTKKKNKFGNTSLGIFNTGMGNYGGRYSVKIDVPLNQKKRISWATIMFRSMDMEENYSFGVPFFAIDNLINILQNAKKTEEYALYVKWKRKKEMERDKK